MNNSLAAFILFYFSILYLKVKSCKTRVAEPVGAGGLLDGAGAEDFRSAGAGSG